MSGKKETLNQFADDDLCKKELKLIKGRQIIAGGVFLASAITSFVLPEATAGALIAGVALIREFGEENRSCERSVNRKLKSLGVDEIDFRNLLPKEKK